MKTLFIARVIIILLLRVHTDKKFFFLFDFFVVCHIYVFLTSYGSKFLESY